MKKLCRAILLGALTAAGSAHGDDSNAHLVALGKQTVAEVRSEGLQLHEAIAKNDARTWEDKILPAIEDTRQRFGADEDSTFLDRAMIAGCGNAADELAAYGMLSFRPGDPAQRAQHRAQFQAALTQCDCQVAHAPTMEQWRKYWVEQKGAPAGAATGDTAVVVNFFKRCAIPRK